MQNPQSQRLGYIQYFLLVIAQCLNKQCFQWHASSAKRAAKRSHSAIRDSSLENRNPKKKKKNTLSSLDTDNTTKTKKKKTTLLFCVKR